MNPVLKLEQTPINIILSKNYSGGVTVLDNVSIQDNLLYPYKKLSIRITRLPNVVITGTYLETVPDKQTVMQQLVLLDKPLSEFGVASLQSSDEVYYFSTFTNNSDNQLMGQSDAISQLTPVESEYQPSTVIQQPQDFYRKGKPGLIQGEELNKLNRLYKYVKFTDINIADSNFQTIALIRTNENYDFTTRIKIRARELFADFTFYCYLDSNNNIQRYLQINHYESIIKSNDRAELYKLVLNFRKETGTFNGQQINMIRVDMLSEPNGLVECDVDIAVHKFEDLLNQQMISPGSITSEIMNLGGSKDVVLEEGIIGYTSSDKLTLVLDGESPIKPLELMTASDLNLVTTPGFYYVSKAKASSWLHRPNDSKDITLPTNCAFRLNVYSDYEQNIRQEYIYESDATLPRQFYRVCQDGAWGEWTEFAYRYHTHRLIDLEATPDAIHVSQADKDKWDKSSAETTNSPWKGIVQTVSDLPNSAVKNSMYIVANPGGIYMFTGTGWEPKTIEALKAFDVDVRQTVNGLITPALYDDLKGRGFGRKIKVSQTKSFFSHVDTPLANYQGNGSLVGNNAIDIVYRPSLFANSIGESSLAIGFGTTTNSTMYGVSFGYNVVNNGNVAIGSTITNGLYSVAIGQGLITGNSSVVFGKFNDNTEDSYLAIGMGNDDTSRANALILHKNARMLETGGFKRFDSAEYQSTRGTGLLGADGTVVTQDKFGLQSDIDRLDEVKMDKGNFITVRITPEDGSDDALYNIAYDSSSMILVTPTGNCLVDSDGKTILPEGIIVDPALGDYGGVIIPANLWSGDTDKTVLAQAKSGSEESEILNIENEYNHTASNYPIMLDFNTYTLTYKSGTTLIWFVPVDEED